MNGCLVALLVVGGITVCMFGGCVVLGMVGAASSPSRAASAATATVVSTSVAAATAAPTAAPKEKEVEAIEVTAGELFDDYHANEVSADDQYKGKTLFVTGTVAKIRKDFTGGIIVDLASSNQFMPVGAELKSSEKSQAATLSAGQKLSVVCTGGGMVIGRPRLRNCVLPAP